MLKYATAVALLLVLLAVRLPALEALPLHNDEGLHLARAIEVWKLHPFWEIRDGKVINHWLIAAFYPQHAPVFAGRIATVFVALLGIAAGYGLVRRAFGQPAALLAGAMWIASPYLFFYERLAFSDAQAGALVVVALWTALRVRHPRHAVLVGAALAGAALFKLTAAPFAATVALAVLLITPRLMLRQRLTALSIIALTVAACFAIPAAYLLLRGSSFDIALGWLSPSAMSAETSLASTFAANLARLGEQLGTYGPALWALLMGAGLLGLPLLPLAAQRRGTQIGSALLLATLLPLAAILALGVDPQPRHFVVALPLLLTLSGAGLGLLIALFRRPLACWGITGALIGALAWSFWPFAQLAYTAPGGLPLSALDRYQFITSHSAGFGLREAVQSFPQTIEPADAPIVGSMFPDSCRRAAYYNRSGHTLICTDAPGTASIERALAAHLTVYVLAEKPPIGLAATAFANARAAHIAGYPRPGETVETASVTLWRLERR